MFFLELLKGGGVGILDRREFVQKTLIFSLGVETAGPLLLPQGFKVGRCFLLLLLLLHHHCLLLRSRRRLQGLRGKFVVGGVERRALDREGSLVVPLFFVETVFQDLNVGLLLVPDVLEHGIPFGKFLEAGMRLMEGLFLSNGQEFFIPQTFLGGPREVMCPSGRIGITVVVVVVVVMVGGTGIVELCQRGNGCL